MTKFSLKVGKDKIQIQHEPNESFQEFQAKVFTLTDIPPKNLKLLFKAKMIKDNPSLFALPQSSQLIVMGTKAGKQLKPSTETKQQKMDIEQNYKIPQRYGLVNVGNTCYMNAALQLLRSIPELNTLIINEKGMNSVEQIITKYTGQTWKQLNHKDITPQAFVGAFLQSHQDYLPLGTQHDSDQFMQEMLSIFSRSNPGIGKKIKQLFQIQFIDVTKTVQVQQQPKIQINHSTKLCCSVGGVEKQLKIGTINQSIKLSLSTQLQKLSSIDNLNHKYDKITRFNTLPQYLLVQMVRFFWKVAADLPGAKPTAAKICKSIDFSHKIDIFDYCTQDLKTKLLPGRAALEQNRKRQQIQYKKQYQAYKQSLGQTNKPQKRIMDDFKQKWKNRKQILKEGLQTGEYELIGTVTHLGNSVQSGHYMCWVKETQEQWTKYDDINANPQPSQKVLYLKGGQPNLQIAYILLFRKIYAKPL